ncbi:hypothetical protein IQ254_18755 [Nodosilinea sp. LEGE 07088]|uniref:hypothetical protein n=1 Tax=Nodosilinea sp. LEGE 07088 TaxID=2777968 RepID=UPI00187E3219|nr:hypothetical protein [Nodosilinea sp. LEGE 07088]MBE9139211.1 hypothetical protein [Nodosilinea sp. LEGE 07088]
MTKTLTITLPDALEQALAETAAQNQTTAEELILAALTQKFMPPSDPDLINDPLFQLAGSITSNIPDLAENHDYYIGQALHEEMNGNDN